MFSKKGTQTRIGKTDKRSPHLNKLPILAMFLSVMTTSPVFGSESLEECCLTACLKLLKGGEGLSLLQYDKMAYSCMAACKNEPATTLDPSWTTDPSFSYSPPSSDNGNCASILNLGQSLLVDCNTCSISA